jgi:hypothetical protein
MYYSRESSTRLEGCFTDEAMLHLAFSRLAGGLGVADLSLKVVIFGIEDLIGNRYTFNSA